MSFQKILIANRGEIAIRIARSARELGYGTVAVYSEADADAPHVAAADEAVCIGPPAPSASYLDIDKVIAAAKATGADAVHPGYGFLAENADFATACAEAGITFIGPPPSAIDLMGLKRAAKLAVMEAGVPCIPGYEGADQEDDTLIAQAKEIGLPVMIKASAGGGGRGMRLVHDEKELPDQIQSARSEAASAFGNGELILEKAVLNPRHVEIQVFADTHGNAIHLGERDCSVQRRHQKVIEESPSPAVDEALRNKMGEAAVAAAKACDYVGAGTVEFLLDPDGNFYFLEMNTRLQVEHPVTELVTGTDLVAWQIRVAAGGKLPMTQDDLTMEGHAVEARLYAEDPANNFMPQTGPVLLWRMPDGIDVRVDHAVQEGSVVTPHYDPMIAKVIAHGQNRDEARQKLAAALDDMALLGVIHNKRFLTRVLTHPAFAAGEATTAFIAEHMSDDDTVAAATPEAEHWMLAGLVQYLSYAARWGLDWAGWRTASQIDSVLKLAAGDEKQEITVRALGPAEEGRRFRLTVGPVTVLDPEADGEEPEEPSEPIDVDVLTVGENELLFTLFGVRQRLHFAQDGSRLFVHRRGRDFIFEDVTNEPPQAADAAGTGVLLAPMDGAVVAVNAAEGDTVETGQVLMVVEAMKMEHPVKADVDGTVDTIHVGEGDQVKPKQVVIELTPDEDE